MNVDLAFFIRRKLSETVQGTAFFDPVALDMDTADFDAGRKVETPAATGLPGGRPRRRQNHCT